MLVCYTQTDDCVIFSKCRLEVYIYPRFSHTTIKFRRTFSSHVSLPNTELLLIVQIRCGAQVYPSDRCFNTTWFRRWCLVCVCLLFWGVLRVTQPFHSYTFDRSIPIKLHIIWVSVSSDSLVFGFHLWLEAILAHPIDNISHYMKFTSRCINLTSFSMIPNQLQPRKYAVNSTKVSIVCCRHSQLIRHSPQIKSFFIFCYCNRRMPTIYIQCTVRTLSIHTSLNIFNQLSSVLIF